MLKLFSLVKFNIGLKGKIYQVESQRLVLASGVEWKDVEDVKSVYTPVFGIPQVITTI